ncbi:MAG: hypothetical protein UX91_C0003G0084 [Candidatus Amesbacteria bacterium GW2011_GWB1_47_19]|nr:MAG: hypothetical protein UW51_C0003G0090 [Candidatus Amesbacteria bacterium GW2011_GWA1_44_24]KKU31515.1 MAG: hypothetical protein UX46_C0005G0084 [Candidatus Amesbacteria bacterium GW2011_GWC1_46_24]KKU67523.1 MAG: hypothetical protein UX91_C0003G0084 [Candidatus Amesbacteria bacterium GW2011_GWB1_47_19]OGD06204.1 MAG: hypothetical protein A2379_01360 [Candidatus Amesbacteria bacterium RIFOXYB1_FULL_47_13]HBC72535.1 hypothetical protein [Candidatus Amesbacteria bacterium]
MAEKKNDNLLKVTVRSRQGLVFEGPLAAVTSYNTKGVFDILPLHTNFVSMIFKKVILLKADGKKEEINVSNGVVIVENNQVKVFLGVGKI